MEEEKVSFEVAVLAKQKNFNIPVFDFFDIRNKNTSWYTSRQDYNNGGLGESLISRPTQALLQKWLRDVHNLLILIEKSGKSTRNETLYIFTLNSFLRETYSTKSYEDVLEKGLLFALNQIK